MFLLHVDSAIEYQVEFPWSLVAQLLAQLQRGPALSRSGAYLALSTYLFGICYISTIIYILGIFYISRIIYFVILHSDTHKNTAEYQQLALHCNDDIILWLVFNIN